MTRKMRQLLVTLVLIGWGGWAAGCADDSDGNASRAESSANSGPIGEDSADNGEVVTEHGGEDPTDHGETPDSADEEWASDSDEGGEGSGDEAPQTPEQKPGQLTAGEWSDLENWTFWQGLFGEQSQDEVGQYKTQWGINPENRFAVRVLVGEAAVVDAPVKLMTGEQVIWEARTDNRGRAELYDGLFGEALADGYSLEVNTSGASTRVDIEGPTGGERLDIVVEQAQGPAHVLDLMFVVDTTGSMSDELSYIQAELRNVIQAVNHTGDESLSLRLSVNFYRDDGDDYVVRPFPFTSDIEQVLDDLQVQTVDGGGDFPEAVDQALLDAIDAHQWSEEATARLLFLVLDAPPHQNQQVLDSLRGVTTRAAQKGVRIIPVVASGIDKPTEFLMRLLSIATGGTYVFLTDDSGIGNSHLEPTIGDYEVEYLNDLIVRLISEYTAR